MLDVSSLGGGYGALPVLDGISFSAGKGEVVGLLGRNGAGKTTTLRVIAGALRATGGSIALEGRDITRLSAFRRARAGIGHVPQGRGIFNRLTVRENLEVGTRAKKQRGGSGIPADVYDYFPILKERGRQMAGTLSGGQQQMLAIGRALCGDPKVLLLDEPSEGIQPNIVQAIAELVPRIARDRGIAVVLVEQNLDLALRASNRCLVVEKGRVVHSATPAELADESLLKDLLAI
jgi:branched-chain amino acid transport system ATP-binding protein